MPSAYFANPVIFIVEVLFGLYMGLVALRIIMQWAKWEYHNPLVQFIIKATQPPVKALRRVIHPIGDWDLATIVLLILLAIIKVVLIGFIHFGLLNIFIISRLAVADIFSLFITLFTASILIQVILSWVSPQGSYNPVIPLISRMNNPLLKPIRQWLPPMGGLDLSPLIAILGLQVLAMLILPLLTGQI